MYPRFLQIIIGIETQHRTHRPVIELSANMKTGNNGAHRPLLADMLPTGNEAAEEGDVADGDNPPSPNAANACVDASALAAADAGTSNAADANVSANAGDQPLP